MHEERRPSRDRIRSMPTVSRSLRSWKSNTSVGPATLAIEMEAAVWTAIVLLAATSLGTLFYVGSRMDALAARLDARMDSGFARVDARMDSGFARVDARFDAVEARLDALAARLDAHLDQHAS